MTEKTNLKNVFCGLSSIYLAKDGIKEFATPTFDYDMPVTVDSLTMSQGEPTINRVKVHGLQADWAVTSTAGEFTFSATVPSISKELVEYFMGDVSTIETSTVNSVEWTGFSASLNSQKIVAGIGLLSEDENSLILIKKMVLYATPLFENASTSPFAFKLTGTIEASTQESDDIAFLAKKPVVTP